MKETIKLLKKFQEQLNDCNNMCAMVTTDCSNKYTEHRKAFIKQCTKICAALWKFPYIPGIVMDCLSMTVCSSSIHLPVISQSTLLPREGP